MQRDLETSVGRLAVFDEGSGPPTFFWPSLYLDHRNFTDVVAALAPERRCIVVDGPGHGRSAVLGRTYDLSACAIAAFQVLDALGVDAVDWVGNAWGGHVGVVATGVAPARVKTLAVIGSPMQPLTGSMRVQLHLLLGILRLGLVDRAGKILAGAMVAPEAEARIREVVRACVRQAPRGGIIEAIRSISLGRPDLVPLLSGITCPTLFVAGEHDAIWTPEVAAAQAAQVPGSRFEVLAGTSHLGALERPAETVALLRALWAGPV